MQRAAKGIIHLRKGCLQVGNTDSSVLAIILNIKYYKAERRFQAEQKGVSEIAFLLYQVSDTLLIMHGHLNNLYLVYLFVKEYNFTIELGLGLELWLHPE